MNWRLVIFIAALFIFLLFASLALGWFLRQKTAGDYRYQPPDNLDHLIACMEKARESHQQFLDMPPKMEYGPITVNNPARYYLNRLHPYTTIEDQQRWVEVYDQVIEALSAIESEKQN